MLSSRHASRHAGSITHRVACVFTQLSLLLRSRVHHHHQLLEARRAERGALLLGQNQLSDGELGAAVQGQLGLAPRGSGRRPHQGLQRGTPRCAGTGVRVTTRAPGRRAPLEPPWMDGAGQIGLGRREDAVHLFLFPFEHPQTRLLLAAVRPAGAPTLRAQFGAQPRFGFPCEILPHPPLVGLRFLPLMGAAAAAAAAALLLGGPVLHGAGAAACQPEPCTLVC